MMAINLKKLNPEQKKAVTHDRGPLLIVAGAGTGKTTVITQRISYLIEQKKAAADEILALTFTEKAAGEMEERVEMILPLGYTNLWISTFHAFAEKILQKHALEIGIPNDFKLLNQTEQWLLVRQNIDKFDLDYYKPLGNPTKFIHALIKLFSRAKDDAVNPEDYLEYVKDLKKNSTSKNFLKQFLDEEEIKTLTAVEKKEFINQELQKAAEVADSYNTYQKLLLEHDALDFGDLINYCLILFKKRPAVLAKYRKQFKYILVDEFQDTNHAQYELVKLLAGSDSNITVVGDDDQAIYKFRGASVSNILEFKQDYKSAKEIFLTKNYRSTQNILDLSYDFIQQNNPDRLEVKLSTGSKKKLSKKLKSSTKGKGVTLHLHFKTVDDEVRGVIKKIAEIKNDNKDVVWSDFAILARTNDSANMFAHGLSRTKIPHKFMASKGLYTKPVILDVLSYLRLLDDYHENSAVHRILNSPVVGLTYNQLVDLSYWSRRKGYSLFTAAKMPEMQGRYDQSTRDRLKQFFEWIDKHTKMARERSVSIMIMAFLEDTGYLKYLTKEENVAMLQATSYLNQFYKKVLEFERSIDDASVKNFLQMIDLELESGELGSINQEVDDGPEVVKIMTVHATKGLEFKYVFLTNLVARKFPTDARPDSIVLPDALVKEILPEGDAHIQEERRLFYVAMTRAKQELYFTSASDYGGQRKKKVSKFLEELVKFGLELDGQEVSVYPSKSGADKISLESTTLGKISKKDLQYLIPKKFSFSQLKLFENCPYHYWMQYILKIPQSGKHFFSFGTSLHNTLQKFFTEVILRNSAQQQDMFNNSSKPSKILTEKELMEFYDNSWIDDWYKDRKQHDEYRQKGQEALEEFYSSYKKELPVPQTLEQPFTLSIKNSENGDVHQIIGKIDRIDKFEDGVEIIDYKTGTGKTQKDLTTEDKQQLMIYQMAAQQQLGLEVKKLTYYYLETGDKVSFSATEKQIDNLQKKIVKIISEIKDYNWPPPTSHCSCKIKDLKNM